MLFAVVAAFRALGILALEVLVADLLVFAGQILIGLVIFGVGLLLANWAARMVTITSAPCSSTDIRVRLTCLLLASASGLAMHRVEASSKIGRAPGSSTNLPAPASITPRARILAS
ncbi:MAG: hypothetical protein H0U74_14005 [Bradymonadaceae bacterium]|nr:hypothetical protein [Lujinxingiaceae bacterium]